MKIHYQIFKAQRLMVQKYLGSFSFDHYKKFMLELINKPEWNYVEKVLTDAREVDPTNAFENLDALVKFREEVIKRNYLNVFLIDTPLSTITTHLYQEQLQEKDYDYKYCSTIDYALDTLELGISADDMEDIIMNLEHRY